MRRILGVGVTVVCLACLVLPQVGGTDQTPARRIRSLTARQLEDLLEKKQYLKLQRELPAAKLTTAERSYFQGIIADRRHKVSDAIALLEEVLSEVHKIDQREAALALRALASDYFEAGRYGDSADAYARLLKRYRPQFSRAETENLSDNRRSFELVRGAPAQQVSGAREFTVATRRDTVGDVEVPVEVGDTKMWWIFDTGANISTISMSTAMRLGLTLSRGSATTKSGATGAEVPLHMSVIPELHFGGAVARHVLVQVMEDKELDLDLGTNGHYAIGGILGYPLLAALGSFTFSGDSLIVAPEGPASSRCAPMYVEEFTPSVSAKVNGRDLLFSFDSGANNGTLTSRFFYAFPQRFASVKPMRIPSSGAGGARLFTAYPLPPTQFHLGTATVTLHDIPVYTQKLGTGLLDRFYGNLGQFLVAPFRSYTIDFSRMQLCVGEDAR